MTPSYEFCDGPYNPTTDVDMCVDPVTSEVFPCPPPVERLAFSDRYSVTNHLVPRIDATPDELAAAELRGGVSQSLRAYLDNGESTLWTEANAGSDTPTGNESMALQNDGVTRADFPVSDAFLSLLNNKGELQIGDTIYKVTRDNVYAVHWSNLAALDQLVPTLSSPAPAADPRITVNAVETSLPRENGPVAYASAPDGPRFHHVPGVGGHCYVHAGSNPRMHGKSYKTNLGLYAEAGVTTEWERKKKFLWVSYWANTWQSGALGYSFTSTLSQGQIGLPGSTPVGPPNGALTRTGVDKVHKTLAWGIFHRITGTIHTRHTVANSSANGYCDTAA